jgi:hypothetical protein
MDQQLAVFPSVSSLIIAALAVFIGPLVTALVARKQMEASQRVAVKQVVSPIRQAWINELRTLLADIIGKCHHYNTDGFEDRGENEYLHITAQIALLALYINPNEQDHVDPLEQVNGMHSSILSGGSGDNDTAFWLAYRQTVILSQAILKKEWERVKGEI